jgi:hypothetical protein
MKKSIFIIFVFLVNSIFGQKAIRFDECEKYSISTKELDSTFKSALHSEPSLGVFNSNSEEFITAYQKMLNDLNSYLNRNNFNWEAITKGFNRIYFTKDGKVEYFIYSFKPNQLSPEKIEQFQLLLTQFIGTYQFPMKSSEGFAQCSPVTYMPNPPKN